MIKPLFDSSFAPPTPNAAIPAQTLCPSNVPLVLLPVRLETRFFVLPGNVTELRVRVYPDKIHVDTHQPELTTDERTVGTQYWQQDWAAGTNVTARADAWSTLADRVGAERAAWIAKVLTPSNIQQRSATPPVPPVFPTLPPPLGPNGESAWRHAPQARLLPDKWIAILHSAGQVALSVTGNPIDAQVNVGPNPGAPVPDKLAEVAIKAGDVIGLDKDMLWLVDFIAAEAKGMALRMTVPATVIAAGIDSLIVFGVATSLGVTNSPTHLADLLDAHRYTDGLEFLRYGTPTNNTDDRRAAFNSDDPGHARTFGLEVMSDPATAFNASAVGKALGLPPARIPTTLGRIGQAAQNHDHDLGSMNTALWQVGWGYFLSNMVGPEIGLTMATVNWARGYFIEWVRAGGPLPSIRCGAQPYGILPVTSLDQWVPGAGETVASQETWLKGKLLKLRDNVWRPVLNTVPRIGLRPSGAADADLADVMSTDGVSHGFNTRAVLGRHYFEHLLFYGQQPFTPALQQQVVAVNNLPRLLGFPQIQVQQIRQARSFMSNQLLPITAPMVQAGEVSPWQKLQPPYISELLALKTVKEIIDYRPAPTATDHATPLLKMLLRQALLREIATATARLAKPALAESLETLMLDVELVDLVDVAPVNSIIQPTLKPTHWLRQLEKPAPGQPAGTTIKQYLEGHTKFDTLETSALGEFRSSLAHIQTLDSESIQLLMQGTLDLSAHRLDAWITSYATKRLVHMTGGGAAGQYIGAYGWVENLKPVIMPTAVPPASLPAGEPDPVFPLPNDTGFIHAPSLTHAATAALLRNAHLGPDGKANPNGQFAIDLSSRRVREASRLLDGVRQGQPLGALLGYYFERRLHDLKLDAFIAPLRGIAPLVVRDREANNAPTEALAANNVVDGFALIHRKQDAQDTTLASTIAGVPSTLAQQQDVTKEIVALIVTVDGLTDALTAEAAYQLVRGNTTRLASTLSAIAQGDALPPELEVAMTPRTGTSLTHRVMMLGSGLPNTGGGWALSYNSTPRPLAERWLNAWCRQLVGDATKIRCTVERVDENGAVVETVAFPLGQVAVTTLDFVYFAGPVGQTAQGHGALCYAEQLVLYHSKRRTGGFTEGANLRLQHNRPNNLAAGETTLFDALESARSIRRLLESARGLLPDDLSPPERASLGTVDFADFDARVVRLENALHAFNKTLTNFVTAGVATTADEFRNVLLNLSLVGVGQAVPCVAVGDTPAIRAALLNQAKSVLRDSAPRTAQCLGLRALPVATDARVRVRQLIERAKMAAGSDLVVMPFFKCDAAEATELTTALAASTAQQGGDPLAVNTWFVRTARVRDNLSRLGACLRVAEVLGNGKLNMTVAQLPFDASETWVGLPPLPGKELPPSKLSLVVQSQIAINPVNALCGMLFDEWVEIVPNTSETTALTFQFDPPNSVAPQNVLVAVPPVPGQDWTTESLRQVLVETLDLAKIRAVDTSQLGAAAHYLPALYVPFNVNDAAVSTNFAPLTAPNAL